MAKLDSIIRLINLLYHRDLITLDNIMEECQVSARTAYRYLDTVSSANIPVYHDKKLGGYTLSRKANLCIDNLRTDENILLVLALRMLSARLNAVYRRTIDVLIKKISARQPYSVQDLLNSVEKCPSFDTEPSDISQDVTSLIIHAAISLHKGIELTLADSERNSRHVVLTCPSLLFEEKWQVLEKNPDSIVGIPFSSIDKVNIK